MDVLFWRALKGEIHMIVQSSNVDMRSKRSYYATQKNSVLMNTWGNFGSNRSDTARGLGSLKNFGELVESKDLETGDKLTEKENVQSGRVSMEEQRVNLQQKFQTQVLNYLLYLLFGKKQGDSSFEEWEEENTTNIEQGFGGFYESSSYYCEQESTSFETTGTVVTADGRQLDFNISLEMTRSFQEYAMTHMDFGMPQLCDPLVINLDMGAAQVTDQKFLFDIDADGEMDEISMLAGGSGYLALDKDENGKIDDGSELFGTASGDGFADLAVYDIDRNGWIDEADEIFDKLRIWTKDEDGNDKLIKLKDAGVGAICLKNADTEFALNSLKDNHSNAFIRKTGIFLYESGGVGTVQHLDLAK